MQLAAADDAVTSKWKWAILLPILISMALVVAGCDDEYSGAYPGYGPAPAYYGRYPGYAPYPGYGYSPYAGSVTIAVGDRPYYTRGPGYYVGSRYYVWRPGHYAWRHGQRVWVHGHYVVR